MRCRVSQLPLLLFAATGPALGCAGTVAGTATGDAESMATTAVVLVERTSDSTEGSRAEASARFVRVASSYTTKDALDAIGASLDLPPRGTCRTVTSLANGAPAGDPAPLVELIDVGGVSLEANGAQTRLLPRQVPDVTDVVSGVVYARAADPGLLPAGTRYAIHVSGGPDVEAFDLSAVAPPDPTDVRVAGEDATGVSLSGVASIEFAWAADGTTDDPASDAVFADLRPSTGSAVRCVLQPTGEGRDGDGLAHSSISAGALGDDRGVPGEGTIVVHRLHREPLRARGIEGGEVRFDFARSIAYRR